MFNDIVLIERNGITLQAHWRYRFKGIIGGGDSVKMPVKEATNPSRTATAVKQTSKAADRNKMLAASLLTKNWDAPKLAKKSLLGIGGEVI
ncbi:MAG: hypothetical protein PHP01_06545 [Phycisphaerae bacterium]|nr:hypothetical protein [Phycisphaerae bacterium]